MLGESPSPPRGEAGVRPWWICDWFSARANRAAAAYLWVGNKIDEVSSIPQFNFKTEMKATIGINWYEIWMQFGNGDTLFRRKIENLGVFAMGQNENLALPLLVQTKLQIRTCFDETKRSPLARAGNACCSPLLEHAITTWSITITDSGFDAYLLCQKKEFGSGAVRERPYNQAVRKSKLSDQDLIV